LKIAQIFAIQIFENIDDCGRDNFATIIVLVMEKQSFDDNEEVKKLNKPRKKPKTQNNSTLRYKLKK